MQARGAQPPGAVEARRAALGSRDAGLRARFPERLAFFDATFPLAASKRRKGVRRQMG